MNLERLLNTYTDSILIDTINPIYIDNLIRDFINVDIDHDINNRIVYNYVVFGFKKKDANIFFKFLGEILFYSGYEYKIRGLSISSLSKAFNIRIVLYYEQ